MNLCNVDSRTLVRHSKIGSTSTARVDPPDFLGTVIMILKWNVYIGPMDAPVNTFGSFWHMVWDLNSNKIAMLTNIIEGNRVNKLHCNHVIDVFKYDNNI